LNEKRYFAVVSGSLEKHASQELQSFGAKVIQEIPRGIGFSCSQEVLYRILYEARLVQRVLLPLLHFPCHSIKYLHQQAHKNISWHTLFGLNQSFGIDSNVSNSFTKHSLYAGQVLKDAICDSFRDRFGQRPSFSNKEPDIQFNLHIHENKVTISLDILGLSLHKRGYRKASVDAPLQETLAAAMIQLSGWDAQNPLWDPMCGSGTILAEALMLAGNIPAGYLRDHKRLPLMPEHDEFLWQSVVHQANSRMREVPPGIISGSDINPSAIDACRDNLSCLPFAESIELKVKRFEAFKGNFSGTIICNPPYGVRLGNISEAEMLYHSLGDFLKQHCKGSTAYILCGSKELVPHLRLRAHWAKSIVNGDLDTRFAKIVIRPDRIEVSKPIIPE
jgi:putative N6-adenine-specific DNA methylase